MRHENDNGSNGSNIMSRLKNMVEAPRINRFAVKIVTTGKDITTRYLIPETNLSTEEQVYLSLKVVEGILRKSTGLGPNQAICRVMVDTAKSEAEKRKRIIVEGLPEDEKGMGVIKKLSLIDSLAHVMTSFWVELNNGDGSVNPHRLTQKQRKKTNTFVQHALQSWPQKYLWEEL